MCYCVCMYNFWTSKKKVCDVKKPNIHTKGSYSLPQKTLVLHHLKCLVWSRAFTSMNYVRHSVAGTI